MIYTRKDLLLKMLDKEFEKATRKYLEELFYGNNGIITSEKKFLLNTSLPFIEYLHQKTSSDFLHSTPLMATWHITSACNFRCNHCYYSETEYSNKNDLTITEAEQLANDLAELGIIKVIITGGEPFLRSDFLDILKIFKKNNISVFIQTNGSVIKDSQIEILQDIFSPYLDVIQISLDAGTAETFKKVRNTSSFDKIISTIKKLVENNIKVSINCTANALNINEIPDLYRLCQELRVMDFAVSKFRVFNESHKSLFVSDRDLMILTSKLLDEKISKDTFLGLNLFSTIDLVNNCEIEKILQEDKYSNFIKQVPQEENCSCNRHDRIDIQSNGDIYMCMESLTQNSLLGNYRKNTLEEIWENRLNNPLFNQRLCKNLKCHSCKYVNICHGGCVARAFSKYNDINMPDSDCKFFFKD